MGKLIGAGKHVSPVTLRTFFEFEPPIGELTVVQYLGRPAAAATTIINAPAYGRVIYDLAVRRELIVIGEDMVNVAYDLPVDAPPETQIEEAEQRLFDIADKGKYGSGFMPFGDATADAIEMAARAYERDGGLSGLSTGLVDLDRMMGGLQNSDLIILAGLLFDGQNGAGDEHRVQHCQDAPHASKGGRDRRDAGRRHCGLFQP